MAEEGKRQIYDLIPQIMRDVGAIGKDRRNPQQGYQFRGIDDVYNALQPVLCKHRVFIVPTVLDEKREERQTKSGGSLIYTTLRMSFDFYAPDGSSIKAVTVGEAMDSGDKSANKAQSAAMKYACLQVFCIPTEGDNDTENATHEVKPKEMSEDEMFLATLNDAFDARDFTPKERGAAVSAVAKSKKVTRLADLKSDDRKAFIDAIAAGKLDKYKAQKAA